ncbi:MAG: hypothetical protein U0704_13185 [Candidatus Eisenbacteria bacterium]
MKAYYPQFEEYCRKKVGGGWVKHGHFVLWGPNGERLEEGEYRDGVRIGSWARWVASSAYAWKTPSAERQYDMGLKPSEPPPQVTIDFCACNKQWIGKPTTMGSVHWKIFGVEGNDCIMEVGGEIEGGELRPEYFRVPRDVGRLNFPAPNRVDFSALSRYGVPDTSAAIVRLRAKVAFK